VTRGSQPRSTTEPAASRRDHAQPTEPGNTTSGILNAARQSGGALGVALLGSLLGSGRALSLHVPLAVAAGGYLVALALAWIAIRSRS
jgi:DHA2 family methylenomycin A resistance protein-like MFS transporter